MKYLISEKNGLRIIVKKGTSLFIVIILLLAVSQYLFAKESNSPIEMLRDADAEVRLRGLLLIQKDKPKPEYAFQLSHFVANQFNKYPEDPGKIREARLAFDILLNWNSPALFEIPSALLDPQNHPERRDIIFNALKDLGIERIIPISKKMYSGDPGKMVLLIGRSITPADREIIAEIRKFMADLNPHVRTEACVALSRVSDAESIPLFLKMASEDPHFWNRERALGALKPMNKPEFIPAIRRSRTCWHFG